MRENIKFEGLRESVERVSSYNVGLFDDATIDYRCQMSFQLGGEMKFESEQRVGLNHFGNDLSVFLKGSKCLDRMKLGTLLEKLSTGDILWIGDHCQNLVSVQRLPDSIKNEQVRALYSGQVRIIIHYGAAYKSLHLNLSEQSSFEDCADVLFYLQEAKPQLAPVFEVLEQFSLRVKGLSHDSNAVSEALYQLNREDLPSDFDFRDFSEFVYLSFRLMYDVDSLKGLKASYGLSNTADESPKINILTDLGPFGSEERELGCDLSDGLVVDGSELHHMLQMSEINEQIDNASERYEGLLKKYKCLFEDLFGNINQKMVEKNFDRNLVPYWERANLIIR